MFNLFGDDVNLSDFIIKVSKAILIAGMIFGTGGSAGFWTEGSYPGEDWAKGVGGAITAFAYALKVQSDASSWWSNNDVDFSAFIIKVSKAIMTAGKMFSKDGNGLWIEGSYPGEDWAKGVGGAITAFAEALKAQSDASSWWSGDFDFAEFIVGISEAIIEVGTLFTENGSGLWEIGTYPNTEWSTGIGDTLSTFTDALKSIVDAGVDIDDVSDIMIDLVEAIIEIGELFSDSDPNYWNLSLLPSSEWSNSIANTISTLSEMTLDINKIKELPNIAENLLDAAEYFSEMNEYPMGDGIKDFSNSIENLIEVLPNNDAVDPFLKLVDGFKELANISWLDLMSIGTISSLIEDLVDSLDDLSENKVESLLKLGAGFQLISLINQKELEEVLNVLEDKASTITNIVDEDSFVRTFLDDIFKSKKAESETKTTTTNTATDEEYSPFEKELLSHIENIDNNIGALSSSQTTHDEKETVEELKSKDFED